MNLNFLEEKKEKQRKREKEREMYHPQSSRKYFEECRAVAKRHNNGGVGPLAMNYEVHE